MSIGRLRRNIDIGLVNKIKAGWKPSGKSLARSSKSDSSPRKAKTYRAARRNKMRSF